MAEQNYGEAERKVEQIIAAAPTNFVALALGTSVAIYRHDCAAVSARTQKLLSTYPQSPFAHLEALSEDAFCGHAERVEGKLAEILSGHPPGYLSPYSLAIAYAAGGDADHATSYLQKAADAREPALLMMKVERAFNPIRKDPRVAAFERSNWKPEPLPSVAPRWTWAEYVCGAGIHPGTSEQRSVCVQLIESLLSWSLQAKTLGEFHSPVTGSIPSPRQPPTQLAMAIARAVAVGMTVSQHRAVTKGSGLPRDNREHRHRVAFEE